MIRIWAKTIKNDKITRKYLSERLGTMDYAMFFDYLRDICENLDVPTPILIKTHLFNYAKYNVIRFKQDDFVEEIDFDKLVLENAFV